MNNDAKEDDLHSSCQGLSNNSIGHNAEWVLVVSSKCISNYGVGEISSHDQNGRDHNWLTRARMIILMTPSVLAKSSN